MSVGANLRAKDIELDRLRIAGRLTLIVAAALQIYIGYKSVRFWNWIGGSTVPLVIGIIIFVLICAICDLGLMRELRHLGLGANARPRFFFRWLPWVTFVTLGFWAWVLCNFLSAISERAITLVCLGLMLLVFFRVLFFALKRPLGSPPADETA